MHAAPNINSHLTCENLGLCCKPQPVTNNIVGTLVTNSIDAYSPLSHLKGKMLRWWITFAIAFVFAFFSVPSARGQSQTQSAQPEVVEHGNFVLHKFEQPIGEETFDTTREAQSLVTRISFKFVDRGTSVLSRSRFAVRTISHLRLSRLKASRRGRRTSTKPSKCKPKKSGCATARNGQKLRVPSSSLPSPVTLQPRCRC